MLSFISLLLLGFSAAAGVFVAPTEKREPGSAMHDLVLDRRGGTPSETGYDGGYYYSFWTDGNSYVIYTLEGGGTYEVQWDGSGDFVAGKGWSTGSAQDITYSASYGPNGDSYLSVYGWFTNPLVEYYIVESWDEYNPANNGNYKGTVYSDGSTYDIYESTRTNEPSIEGTATFNQYWSVRQNQRQGGTVTTSNHFNAWNSLGLETGTFNYQVVAVEAWSGSGEATVTVG